VVAVNDDTPDQLALELESPIKQQTPLLGNTYSGSVIVFDNLFEVFDRGLITPISVTHK
jgi:hypothetical protein